MLSMTTSWLSDEEQLVRAINTNITPYTNRKLPRTVNQLHNMNYSVCTYFRVLNGSTNFNNMEIQTVDVDG